MKQYVLFVDDDAPRLESWIAAIDFAGVEVLVAREPDSAIELFNKHQHAIRAVVIDVMLPVGSLDIVKTEGGLRTGVVLLDMLRQKKPELPAIFLTIRRAILNEAKERRAFVVSKALGEPSDLKSELKKCAIFEK